MKTSHFIGRPFRVCAAIAAACFMSVAISGHAQTPAANISPDLQEIVKLAQAHMTDDVVVSYIKGTGKSYNLSADDMVYLNSQGVSQPVLSALLQSKSVAPATPAPPPAAPATPPPSLAPVAPEPVAAPMVAPPTPTFDYFQGQLSPYGHWMDIPEIGACWVPNEASIPGWRPYVDAGHWEYTDAGEYWRSDYPWGEIGFHYGRWLNDARTGFVWAWAPDYDWAPSWVSWRYAEGGYIGWAPLPWGARYRAGFGMEWHGEVGVDIGFGLGADAFVFVGGDHFMDRDYRHALIDHERAREFYRHSEIHNGYRMEHGRFVAEGVGRERLVEATHHEIVVRPAHELRAAEEHHNGAIRAEQHPEVRRAGNDQHVETFRPAVERGPGIERESPGSVRSSRPGAEREPYGSTGSYERPGAPSTTHGAAPPKSRPSSNERKNEKSDNQK